MKQRVDVLITGASEVLTCVSQTDDPIGRIKNGAVAIAGERIAVVGSASDVSAQADVTSAQIIDAAGKIVAPGFCHTHLVFGGSRAHEYAARMTHTAAEIKAMGIPTGILATVEMTRRASLEILTETARDRLQRMLAAGTTTVESKSGYGLSLEHELKQLEVNRRLQASQPVDIISTFLGAHEFPLDVPRERYVEDVIQEQIPSVAEKGLAAYCDVYCDQGIYSVDEARRILEAGLASGLKPKIHVDAYANIGGSSLAADLQAVSADHLNYTKREEMAKLAEAGTIAVVMPALDFAVAHPRPFDARAMVAEGLTLALATDICPGCWAESMQLVMMLACRIYRLSPEEALLASTYGAAKALELADDRGTLEAGKLADIQIWDIPTVADLIYRLGNNATETVIKRGRVCFERK
jgi:imidazolonepropionase